MTIISLNESLQSNNEHNYSESPDILKYQLNSRDIKYIKGSIDNINLQNYGLFGLLSYTYNNHLNVIINPHDIWILILSQFKEIIKENSEFYRHLFTDSPDKKELCVITDSVVELPISTIVNLLNENIKFDSSIIFSKFSTDNTITQEIKSHLFLDMSSPFYSYTLMLCGIKSIKLGGNIDDWIKLKAAFANLNQLFYNKDNDHYILWSTTILSILDKFINVDDKDLIDLDFFKNIFTQKNMGSGGDLIIDGWITQFYYNLPKMKKIQNFSSHISKVEYSNKSTNQDFIMISGGFSFKPINEFIELEYSKHIFEKLKN